MLIARASYDGQSVQGHVEGGTFFAVSGDVYDTPVRTGDTRPLSEVALEPPVIPGRVFLVLYGYRTGFLADGETLAPEHAAPRFREKPVSPIGGDGSVVIRPSTMTGEVSFEPELAVVIGKPIYAGSRYEASQAIFGYTIFNDVTALELVRAGDTFLAKSMDTFAAMGPWIRTDLTETEVEAGLAVTARVDGAETVVGNTKDFKLMPSAVVSYLSGFVTLRPGDIISLGAPGAAEVRPGQRAELEVEGVGILRNTVASAAASPDVRAVGPREPTR